MGAEVMGHSWDDRTRYSAALLSSTDGNVGLPYGNAYTGFFTFSQAFDTGKLGVDRIGAYAMIGPSADLLPDAREALRSGVRGSSNQVLQPRRLCWAVLFRPALRSAGGHAARFGQRLVRSGLRRLDRGHGPEQQRAGRRRFRQARRRRAGTAFCLNPTTSTARNLSSSAGMRPSACRSRPMGRRAWLLRTGSVEAPRGFQLSATSPPTPSAIATTRS